MVLSSLQDQSHVASLLGYSNFGEVTALGPPLTPAVSVRPPSSSSSAESYDPLHLAEVLLRTLLLSIGFYTVCNREHHVLQCFTSISAVPLTPVHSGAHSKNRALFLFTHPHVFSFLVCAHTGAGIRGIGEKQ